MKKQDLKPNIVERPPVIVVMGHIDHGKSTLLDHIRKSNVVEKESGGITQHVSAYEVVHKNKSGEEKRITFLDTPGHEAFSWMRACGTCCADIAILVVSAEDGVKAQTMEAYEEIKNAGIPFVVAINKIDKEGANIEKAKQSLAEKDIFVEGYGGDIPFVAISAKTGQGVDELLDMMLLVAELEELKGNTNIKAVGIVLESNMDPKKGISVTLIIKEGTLKKGMFVVAGKSISPVRIMENFLGENIDEASFSTPVRVIGFNSLPKAGLTFSAYSTKKEAEKVAEEYDESRTTPTATQTNNGEKTAIPLVIKADVLGALEAIKKELAKIESDSIFFKIVNEGVGDISENDIKSAHLGTVLKGGPDNNAIIAGFHVGISGPNKDLADRSDVVVKTFDIIYKLTEWLGEEAKKRTPKVMVEETKGKAKIMRVFSKTKDKQVIGGKVTEGALSSGNTVKVFRRDHEVGRGKVIELQSHKVKSNEVMAGSEFGVMIEAKTEIAAGDTIEAFNVVER